MFEVGYRFETVLCPDQLSVLFSSIRLPLYLVFLAVSLLFLVVNLVCALLVKMTAADVKTIVLVRVTINDSLFVLCAISLSVCLYKVAKMSLANIYLESKVESHKQDQLRRPSVLQLMRHKKVQEDISHQRISQSS